MNSDVLYFYDGIEPLVRIVVVGTLAYLFLLLTLRVSGSRTLSKMNAFDFIVTVGLGSAFGRILTDRRTSLSEGVVAFALLAVLQFLLSEGRLRWKWFKQVVDIKPVLLYYDGQFLKNEMRRSRLCTSDVEGAVRENNRGTLADVEAVVLEAAGHFGIIYKSEKVPDLAAKLVKN